MRFISAGRKATRGTVEEPIGSTLSGHRPAADGAAGVRQLLDPRYAVEEAEDWRGGARDPDIPPAASSSRSSTWVAPTAPASRAHPRHGGDPRPAASQPGLGHRRPRCPRPSATRRPRRSTPARPASSPRARRRAACERAVDAAAESETFVDPAAERPRPARSSRGASARSSSSTPTASDAAAEPARPERRDRAHHTKASSPACGPRPRPRRGDRLRSALIE